MKTSEKLLALNKAGHGLHVCDDVFRAYSTSDKIRGLVKSLGWADPVIPQSMYIFKQPRIGGEVTSHQDSCFLHTEDVKTGEVRDCASEPQSWGVVFVLCCVVCVVLCCL